MSTDPPDLGFGERFSLLEKILIDLPVSLLRLIIEYQSGFLGVYYRQFGQDSLSKPYGLVTDGQSRLYANSWGSDHIHIFHHSGKLLSQWSHRKQGNTNKAGKAHSSALTIDEKFLYVVDYAGKVQVFSLPECSSLSREFSVQVHCMGIYIHKSLIYLSNFDLHSVLVYTIEGKFLRNFGKEGTGKGELLFPYGLTVNEDLVYICDSGNNRITIFTIEGRFWGTFGNFGDFQHRVELPQCLLALGSSIFVSDKHWIRQFDKRGTCLKRWGGDSILRDAAGFLFFDGMCYVSDYADNSIKVFE